MDDTIKARIIAMLEQIVGDLAPHANLRAMYGGTVIELEKDITKSRIGGFYAYDSHVSLELAKGATFDDPGGVLEGSGKLRRHVKLHVVADIANKDCAGFLQQAIAHQG